MAAITATSILTTATTVTPAAVAASDTIASSQFGSGSLILGVINGGGVGITVTLEDPGTTAVGNAGAEVAQSVPAGETRYIKVTRNHVDPATGVATITYSATASVTYTLMKAA